MGSFEVASPTLVFMSILIETHATLSLLHHTLIILLNYLKNTLDYGKCMTLIFHYISALYESKPLISTLGQCTA